MAGPLIPLISMSIAALRALGTKAARKELDRRVKKGFVKEGKPSVVTGNESVFKNQILKKSVEKSNQEGIRKLKADAAKSLKTKSPNSMMNDSKKMFDAVLQGIPKAERDRARKRLLIKTKTKRIELEAKKSPAQKLKDKFNKDK